MKIMNYKDIVTSSDDDFLYERLQKLFNQIKITQGGTALDATLKRHQRLRNYAMAKQIEKIKQIETRYFNEDGSLNDLAITAFLQKNTLHK